MTTPIKGKTYLVQFLLIIMSVVCVLLGMLLMSKSIYFFPCIQTVTTNNETVLQVGPGQISLAHVGIFLGFLLIYLQFEFYSLKPAFYTLICTAVATGTSFVLLNLMQTHLLQPDISQTDSVLNQAFSYNRLDVFATILAMTAGVTLTLFLAATIKRLTHNYLMFIRFPIASLIGFGVFTGTLIYITQFQAFAISSMITSGITPYSQFVALILAAVVPLYVLRLFLSIFRGRAPKDKHAPQTTNSEEKTHASGLFRPAENVEMLTPPSDTPATPAAPLQPDSTNKSESLQQSQPSSDHDTAQPHDSSQLSA